MPLVPITAQFISHAVGAAVFLVGCLVLVGWKIESVLLKSVSPGLPTMKPDTAIAFLLAGLSLWLWGAPAPGPMRRRSAQACAVAAMLVGLPTLIASLSGWDLAIPVVGLMAPATALNLVLIGCALLLLDVETSRGYRPARFLILAATFLPVSALLIYAYAAQSGDIVAPYESMALHTAATLALLCAGVLVARPLSPSPSARTMPGETRGELYAWLPAAVAALAVMTLAIGNTALRYVEARLVASAGERLALAAADIADKLDLLLAERYGDIRIMAQTPAFRDRDVAAMTRHLRALLEAYPVYQWMGVTDAQGRIIAATHQADVGRDHSRAPWFQAVRDGSGIHVEDADVSEESGGVIAVSFTAPIRAPDGALLGAVTTRVGLPPLENVFLRTTNALQAQYGTGTRIEYQFLRRDGTLIADSHLRAEGTVNLKLLGLPSALFTDSAQPGYVEEMHLRRHVPVVTGYAMTEQHGSDYGLHWGVLVRMGRSDVLASVHAALVRLGAAGAFVVVPLLGFLLMSTRRLKTEWAQAQKESARATAAEAVLRERHTALQRLVAAVREVTAESDLERFLQRLTDAACRLTGARYGALGVFDKDGKRLARFFTAGIDEATRKAIGDLPTGQGLLGALAHEADALRLKDLTRHPASAGFPPHHPPMRSFLGMSIRAHGRLFGRLYLTEKRGADEFSELDEQIIVALAAQAGVAIENVQLLRDVQHAKEQYRAIRDQLANVLLHSPDIIIFTDPEGRISLFNAGAERVLGYAAAEVMGKPATDLYMDPTQRPVVLAKLATEGEVIGREVRLRAKDGRPVTVSLTISPYRDAEGRVIGTVGISKDITAAKRLEEALRTSNQELENFVYAISHDLQTPLRAIHGFADLLLKRVKDKLEERERHFVERIQAGTQRMAFLINDLLEYSRIERITHPFEAVPMEEVLAEVLEDISVPLQQSHAAMRREGSLPVVWADRVRMVQVWTNLLTNAIKFAKPGAPPHVAVRHREDEREFTFLVQDDGIGIPPEFHARVFDLFRRLHTQEQYEGTGVGLAIVKRIVEFHKGRVWVESAEGRGSTFFFTIPKQPTSRKEQSHDR
jgi:PAS domain S-box-containing protein